MAIIEAQNVTKMLNGRTILDRVSFEVKEGEIFGFVGPNGAGKTTTLKILLGLLKPTYGHALVFGKLLGDNDDLRRRVGVLLEHDGLYECLSAYENLRYYAQLYQIPSFHERIMELLEFVALSDRKDNRVGEFSKGMKRRLAIARSIIHDPDVLFLDEPASGLDPEAQKMVRDLILYLARERGRTIFLNSHDLDEVQRICSKIAILHSGEIKAFDSIENLRRKFSTHAIEIALTNDKEAEKALDLLKSLDYVSECERDNMRITTIINDVEPSTLLNALINGSIQVEEVKNVTKSLEDIYMKVVNQSEGRI